MTAPSLGDVTAEPQPREVGDTFRYPLLGSLPPACCIGVNDTENWDLGSIGYHLTGAEESRPGVKHAHVDYGAQS